MKGGFIHAFTLRSVATRGKGEISEIGLHSIVGDHCSGFRNWTRLHVQGPVDYLAANAKSQKDAGELVGMEPVAAIVGLALLAPRANVQHIS